MRLTTPKHHDTYIDAIASQMGATRQEALNYLLWELRKNNFQFGGSLPQSQPQQPSRLDNPYYDSSTFEQQATVMSGLSFIPQSPQAIQEFEDLAQEIDPVIQRLINSGLEMEF
jgi:hypothetical protein